MGRSHRSARHLSFGSVFRSRNHNLGPFDLIIESPKRALQHRWEALFGGFPTASADPGRSVKLLRVITDESGFRAELDGLTVGAAEGQNELELLVSRTINRRVLDAEPSWLHLHAGAVRKDERTVLVVGTSMSGKSTLVAQLVADGWAYLSDEQVGVTSDGHVLGYPRPITLRSASFGFFPSVLDEASTHPPPDRVEVPPSALGAVYRGPSTRPVLIVRPDVGSDGQPEQLSSALALQALFGETLDLERAGQAGVDALVALVSHAPCYSLPGRRLAENVQTIGELAAAATQPGQPPLHDCTDSTERVRASHTQGWLFPDGSASLYHLEQGVLAMIDAAGYNYWSELRQGVPADPTPGQVAFMTELRSSGFLSESEAAQ